MGIGVTATRFSAERMEGVPTQGSRDEEGVAHRGGVALWSSSAPAPSFSLPLLPPLLSPQGGLTKAGRGGSLLQDCGDRLDGAPGACNASALPW